MSSLYQKDYLNLSPTSQNGGVEYKDRNGILIVTILFILIAIIIDVATHSQTSSTSQKAMTGLWAIMMGLYFIFVLIIFTRKETKHSKALWVLNIVATVFISLDLIWACVLVAISENDLSTKEKGKLYGNMIVLYLALISLQLHRQFKIKKVIK